MAPKNPDTLAKKNAYLEKLKTLVKEMPKILIIEANHVGSKQMQAIRIGLRGTAEILMGKNTMVRKGLGQYQDESGNDIEKLIAHVRGNIGFIFTRRKIWCTPINCTGLNDTRIGIWNAQNAIRLI